MSDPDLQLDADPRTAHDSSAVRQRVAWAVLALVLVAGLAGLLGPGPLSWASAATPDGLVEVGHSRFVRHIADTSLELRVLPDPRQPGTARVWISSEYLAAVNVQQVTPEPDTWTAMGGGVELAFPADGPDPVTVQIEIRPDDLFLLRGAIGVPGRQPVEFWQFVHP